jgi:hypothetical protein
MAETAIWMALLLIGIKIIVQRGKVNAFISTPQ